MPKKDEKKEKKSASKTTRKKRGGGLSDVIGAEHKKARRVKVSRKAMRKDELQESTAKIVEYLTAHGNNVLMIAGSVIAVVLIAVLLNFYSASKRERASELFTKARNLYDLALNDTPPSADTLNGSREIFDMLISSYEGRAEAALAHLYEGNIYYNLAEYDKSVESYEKFLVSGIDNETYDIIANTNIAYCYKNTGDYDKAIERFKSISNDARGFIKESALFDLGLTYEKVNNNAEAIKVYHDFIENYPTSSLIERVQERVNSIQAK